MPQYRIKLQTNGKIQTSRITFEMKVDAESIEDAENVAAHLASKVLTEFVLDGCNWGREPFISEEKKEN